MQRCECNFTFSSLCDSTFKAIFWDSYFKMGGIQESDLKLVGFRIQITSISSRALEIVELET